MDVMSPDALLTMPSQPLRVVGRPRVAAFLATRPQSWLHPHDGAHRRAWRPRGVLHRHRRHDIRS